MKRPLPTPTQSSDLVNKDGQPGTHFYRWMDGVNQSVIDTQDTLTSLQTNLTSLQSSAATIPSGSAPYYFCRAWVNFNGTNAAIRGSGNIASVTRNSTGFYTITFSTPLPDANYACTSAPVTFAGISDLTVIQALPINASSFQVYAVFKTGANASSNSPFDPPTVQVAIFR